MRENFDISQLPGVEDWLPIVFSFCTMAEILACRRICKSWKNMVDNFITNWTKGLNRMFQDNPSIFEEYSCWKKLYHKLMREKNRDQIILLSNLCFEFLKRPISKRRIPISVWLDPIDIAIISGNLDGVESFLPHGLVYDNFKAGQYFVLACKHKRGQIARWLIHE